MITPSEYIESIIYLINEIKENLDDFIDAVKSDDDSQLGLLHEVDGKLVDVVYIMNDTIEDSLP